MSEVRSVPLQCDEAWSRKSSAWGAMQTRTKERSGGEGGYHWRKLPQVSLLPRQRLCQNEHVFCRDKSMLVVTKVLPRKNNNFCYDKHLPRQIQFCRNKTHLLPSRQNFCRDQNVRQAYFCRTNTCDKHICRDKNDTCSRSRQL